MSLRSVIAGRGGLLLALAAVALGGTLIVVALAAQESAPRVRDSGRIDSHPSAGAQDRAEGGPAKPPPLGPSRPVSLEIPSLRIKTVVNPIGLAPDGTLAVPQPGPKLNEAAWFENSPTPGQPGPSIIEGHVDSASGPSIFFRLGDIKPKDRVIVHRADGRTLTFRVDAVRDFKKSSFPTELVYGGNLSKPSLRLITCSDFDTTVNTHVGNAVVFTHLVSATDAS